MTVRPGQPSRKSPPAGTTKPSSKGMDVVMMTDFEQRHHTNKSRSHSPFGHIGSPTTPLNFEQLFLQGHLPLNSELSQHDQNMLQAQLLNSMRTSGMAPKPKQQQQQSQPSLAMLDQLRQAYNRGEQEQAFNRGEREQQAEWNARAHSFAAHQQQQQQQQQDTPSEPTTIALLQQKFAQLERHKAEIQKSVSQPQQMQIYPTQWPMPVVQPPPPVSSTAFPESRHFVPTSGSFYSFQQAPHPAPPVMPPPPVEVPEQFYSTKQEVSWRPAPDARPAPPGPAWSHANASMSEMGSSIPPLVYMTPQQAPQFLHQAPKPVDYSATMQQQQHRVPDFAVPPPVPFTSFQMNAPSAPPVLAGTSVGVSSRCDKTGGHSVEIKSVPDHYRSDESEMSLDNFSGRVAAHIVQPSQVQSSVPSPSQIPFSSNFHMLPQSSKSAFSTFTRPSSNLNPASTEGVVTKSLLFNDTYRRSQEVMPDTMHDDVDTELHL